MTELFLLFETPCEGVCFELALRDTFDLLTFIFVDIFIKVEIKFFENFPTSNYSTNTKNLVVLKLSY